MARAPLVTVLALAAAATLAACGSDEPAGTPATTVAGGEPVDRILAANGLGEEHRPGAELFVQTGCTVCHTYGGEGSQTLDAPDLTAIGAQQGKDAAYFEGYLEDPGEFGHERMPAYRHLGEEKLQALAELLAASTGGG